MKGRSGSFSRFYLRSSAFICGYSRIREQGDFMSEVVLRGRGITRRWGGVVAVNGVSIDLARGEVHAVIGTNGAGKSTLINVLSGEIPASSGTVELLGADVTRWTQPRRAQHAILLVEHDMDAVFRIADRITVLVDGAIIASDVPAAVRASREVQTAYLGGAL